MVILSNLFSTLLPGDLKSFLKNEQKKNNLDNINDEEMKGWFLVPFISKVAEKFKNIANIIKTKLVFFSI